MAEALGKLASSGSCAAPSPPKYRLSSRFLGSMARSSRGTVSSRLSGLRGSPPRSASSPSHALSASAWARKPPPPPLPSPPAAAPAPHSPGWAPSPSLLARTMSPRGIHLHILMVNHGKPLAKRFKSCVQHALASSCSSRGFSWRRASAALPFSRRRPRPARPWI